MKKVTKGEVGGGEQLGDSDGEAWREEIEDNNKGVRRRVLPSRQPHLLLFVRVKSSGYPDGGGQAHIRKEGRKEGE